MKEYSDLSKWWILHQESFWKTRYQNPSSCIILHSTKTTVLLSTLDVRWQTSEHADRPYRQPHGTLTTHATLLVCHSLAQSSRSPTWTCWVRTKDRTETGGRDSWLWLTWNKPGEGGLRSHTHQLGAHRSLWHSVMTRTRKHRTTVLSSFFSRRRISWVTSGWGTALCVSTSPSRRRKS